MTQPNADVSVRARDERRFEWELRQLQGEFQSMRERARDIRGPERAAIETDLHRIAVAGEAVSALYRRLCRAGAQFPEIRVELERACTALAEDVAVAKLRLPAIAAIAPRVHR